MKVYLYTNDNVILKKSRDQQNILEILEKIAETSNTDDLVVAIYFLSDRCIWSGVAYKEWFTPSDFYACTKRKWAFIRSFRVPEDLPERFRLIRMVFGTSDRYPQTVTDRYRWQYKYQTFYDHLASVFAHELHHYREYHLGLHPNEGEQSACKWSNKRLRECGILIEAKHISKPKPRKKKIKVVRFKTNKNPRLLTKIKKTAIHLNHEDFKVLADWIQERLNTFQQNEEIQKQSIFIEQIRTLPEGTPLRIKYAGHRLRSYCGTTATKVRNLKCNSKRVEILAYDGKLLRWPMSRLEILE